MSSQSLEELVLDALPPDDVDEIRVMNGLVRFTNLKDLSFRFDKGLNDDLPAYSHRLQKLRFLTIRASLFNTGDGLVNLVHHLPHLERLSLHTALSGKRVLLQTSTYSRFCGIYRSRNQKFVIYNFDRSKEFNKQGERKQYQPFGVENQHGNVQFISMESKPALVADFVI